MSDEAAESAAPEPQEKDDKGDKPEEKTASSRDKAEPSNPLGDEQRGFSNAFWQGQRFMSPEMSGGGPSAHIGRADIRDLQIGNRTEIFIGHSVAATPGSVRDDVLDWVRSRYVEVPGYDDMAAILRDRRVLLLRGHPGTGRFTTGLHLLDEVASARLFRTDGKKAVSEPKKRDFPEEHAGYVAELSREDGVAVTEEQLDKLRDVMAARSAFCVLISDTDSRDVALFGGYAASYEPPDPDALLRRHAEEEVLPGDPPELEQRLTELRAADWVAKALGPRPRPMEVVRVAIRLAEHARGAMSRAEVEAEAAEAVRFQVSEWFAPLQAMKAGAEHDEAFQLAAFRIALAVLNESPYPMVAQAARQLGLKLIRASADKETKHASLFSDDHASRLPALRAEMCAGWTTFGTVRLSMELLAFHDGRYPQAILRYVWKNHQGMAGIVVEWLRELCAHVRPVVWVRAAQAVGFLGSLDFGEIFTNAIHPAAQSDDEEDFVASWYTRTAAAVALDQAAQHDETLSAAIHERLRSWRRTGSFAERWTAAATYGFVLGGRKVDDSLTALRVLGTPTERRQALADDELDDRALVVIAGLSIAKLFAFGESEAVLDRLETWIADRRISLRSLALSAIRQLATLYGFELDHPAIGAGRDASTVPERMKRWPLLLSVHVRNPELTMRIATLVRELLRREGDQIAKQTLGKWIRQSERNAELLEVLADFIPHIVRDRADEQRLVYLLDRLTKDWAEPLRDDVADRLRDAVLSSREGSLIA
jgi:hypothetical protein